MLASVMAELSPNFQISHCDFIYAAMFVLRCFFCLFFLNKDTVVGFYVADLLFCLQSVYKVKQVKGET